MQYNSRYLLILFSLFVVFFVLPEHAFAQVALSTPIPSKPPLPTPVAQNRTVSLSATVGDYILTISGTIAPYASVTLIGGDTPLKATTADAQGMFSIQIKVAKGFSEFCLDGIDIKRYGESYSCFTINPAYSDFSDSNLYLPPTVGIERKEVTVGESISARGYGMPGSTTRLHLSDGRFVDVPTDQVGLYEVHITVAVPGSYSLFANARLNKSYSVNPKKKIGFSAISQWENIRRLIVRLLTPPLLYVLILLFILIAILIHFLLKQYSSWRRALRKRAAAKAGEHRLLHHAWFVGY